MRFRNNHLSHAICCTMRFTAAEEGFAHLISVPMEDNQALRTQKKPGSIMSATADPVSADAGNSSALRGRAPPP